MMRAYASPADHARQVARVKASLLATGKAPTVKVQPISDMRAFARGIHR